MLTLGLLLPSLLLLPLMVLTLSLFRDAVAVAPTASFAVGYSFVAVADAVVARVRL